MTFSVIVQSTKSTVESTAVFTPLFDILISPPPDLVIVNPDDTTPTGTPINLLLSYFIDVLTSEQ